MSIITYEDTVQEYRNYKQLHTTELPYSIQILEAFSKNVVVNIDKRKLEKLSKLPFECQRLKIIGEFICFITEPSLEFNYYTDLLNNPNWTIQKVNSKKTISITQTIAAHIHNRKDEFNVAHILITKLLSEKLHPDLILNIMIYSLKSIGLKETLKFNTIKKLMEVPKYKHKVAYYALSDADVVQQLIDKGEKQFLKKQYDSLNKGVYLDKLLEVDNAITDQLTITPRSQTFWEGLTYATTNNKYVYAKKDAIKSIYSMMQNIKDYDNNIYNLCVMNYDFKQLTKNSVIKAIIIHKESNESLESKFLSKIQFKKLTILSDKDRIKILKAWFTLFGVNGLVAYMLNNNNSRLETWKDVSEFMFENKNNIKWQSNNHKDYVLGTLHKLLNSMEDDKMLSSNYTKEELECIGINNIIFELQKDMTQSIKHALQEGFKHSNTNLQINDVDDLTFEIV